MEKMPHKDVNDLDYLAQLGFGQVPVDTGDLEELRGKIRARAFSYNSGSYFAFICLLTGVLLGASLFFALYEAPPERIAVDAEPIMAAMPARTQTERELPVQQLDTITIVKENFVKPALAAQDPPPAQETADAALYHDSAAPVLAGHMEVTGLLKPLREEKLRYIANAPVFYIHDLKITDYRLLYFKKNHFVNVSGTAATSAVKENPAQSTSQLKQSADTYLHEELADALLEFKKGRYDRSIYLFNHVASYNAEDINCDFYLGMSYYYKKNYEKAIPLLDKCTFSLNNTFLQEAAYYKAVCLYESGRKNEAGILFKQIAEEGEFYAGKAGEMLMY